jgi:hypothetical protein
MSFLLSSDTDPTFVNTSSPISSTADGPLASMELLPAG